MWHLFILNAFIVQSFILIIYLWKQKLWPHYSNSFQFLMYNIHIICITYLIIKTTDIRIILYTINKLELYSLIHISYKFCSNKTMKLENLGLCEKLLNAGL